MAQFGSNELWIRYHQNEGFRVGVAECRECHYTWYCAIEPETVAWKLECPNKECGSFNNWFNELSSNRK